MHQDSVAAVVVVLLIIVALLIAIHDGENIEATLTPNKRTDARMVRLRKSTL
ncbi:MAG TPA: hypothetical protein VLV31_02055 [Candidatus Acidoferrales bacterium]|nr:hypothetical protein [Candidatus Acidoferrales bacterium]